MCAVKRERLSSWTCLRVTQQPKNETRLEASTMWNEHGNQAKMATYPWTVRSEGAIIHAGVR